MAPMRISRAPMLPQVFIDGQNLLLHANFKTFANAMLLEFRALTGENW